MSRARRILRRVAPAVLLVTVALTAGCAPRPLYDWGSYEESLQASYIDHDQAQALASLEATLQQATQRNVRVPPGIYAEYGFLLYRAGQGTRAVEFFEREAALYPESKMLMDRLTARVREQEAAKSTADATTTGAAQ